MPIILRFLVLAVALVAPATAAGQSGNGAASEGIYTEAQARKGEAAFDKNCSDCHAPASHTGPGFVDNWVGRSAFDLFDQLRTTMPNDKPGKLKGGQYADIVAYLLELNGFPAGKMPLPGDDEKLKQIQIAAPPATQ